MFSSMARARAYAGLLWETYFPFTFGGIAGLLSYLYGNCAFIYLTENEMQIGSIYSSAFDVATIFTAFLLTFYTLIITADRGFIGRAKGTRPYLLLLSYTLRALGLGAAVVALSIPMMVVEPAPTSPNDPSLYAVAIWAGLTIWAAGAFVRAAHIFAIFAREHG